MESEELHSFSTERVRTRRRGRWMEQRGEQQQLDYNAPLLSVRRLAEVSNGGGRAPADVGGSKSIWKLSSELSAEPLRLPGSVPFGWEDRPGKPKQQQQQHHRRFSSSSSSSPARYSSSNSTSCSSPVAAETACPASPSPLSPLEFPPISHRSHKPPPPPPPPPPPRPSTNLYLRPSLPAPMSTIRVPSSPSSSSPSSISHSSLLLSLSPPPSHIPKSSSSPSSPSSPSELQDLRHSPGHIDCNLAHESTVEPASSRQSFDNPSSAQDEPEDTQLAEEERQEKENADYAGALVVLEQVDDSMHFAEDVKVPTNLAISASRSSASTRADDVPKTGLGCSRKLSKTVPFSSCSRFPSLGFIRKAVAQLYRRAAASARSISISKCRYIEAAPGAVCPAKKAARWGRNKEGTLAIRSVVSISQAIELTACPPSSSPRPIERQQLSEKEELLVVDDAGKAAQSCSELPSSGLVITNGSDHGSSHEPKRQGGTCISRGSSACSQSSPMVPNNMQSNSQTSPIAQRKMQSSSRSSPNGQRKMQHMAVPHHLLQVARASDDNLNRRCSVYEELQDFYDAPSRFGSRTSSPGRFNVMPRRAGSWAMWPASPSTGEEAFADATSSPLQTPRDSLSDTSAAQSCNISITGDDNLAGKSERPSSGSSSLSKRTGKALRLDTVPRTRSSNAFHHQEPQAAREANALNATAIASGDQQRRAGDRTSIISVAGIEFQDCPGYRRRCKFLSGEHELRRPLKGRETYDISPDNFTAKAAIASLSSELQLQQPNNSRSNAEQSMSSKHRQVLVRQSSLNNGDRAAYYDDHRQASVPPIFPPKFQRRLLIGRPGAHIAQVADSAEEDVGWPFGLAGNYQSISYLDKNTSPKRAKSAAVPAPPLPPSPAVSWLKKALLSSNMSCKTAPLLDVLQLTDNNGEEGYTVAVVGKEKLQLRVNKASAPGQKRWEELVKNGR